jgi:hypothetical protein
MISSWFLFIYLYLFPHFRAYFSELQTGKFKLWMSMINDQLQSPGTGKGQEFKRKLVPNDGLYFIYFSNVFLPPNQLDSPLHQLGIFPTL